MAIRKQKLHIYIAHPKCSHDLPMYFACGCFYRRAAAVSQRIRTPFATVPLFLSGIFTDENFSIFIADNIQVC